MVQEFNVLRCFSCDKFQVHQVKKAKKWTCKVCGEKQSVSKIYGQGRAPDCRRHVQKLNMIQGEREQLIGERVMDADDEEEFYDQVTDAEKVEQENLSNEREQVGSKWEKFIETEKKNEESLEEELWDGIPVTMDKKAFEGGTKRGKQPKKKATQSNDELRPRKKKMKTQDFDDDKNKLQPGRHQRRNLGKVKEVKEKMKSKWDVFNPISDEILVDETLEPFDKNVGNISTSKRIDMVELNDSTVKKSYYGTNVASKSNTCHSPSTSSTKTPQSKWSKFLGSSNCAEEEVEEENIELYSRFAASDNSPGKIQLLTTERPTCNKTMDSNTLSDANELNYASRNPIPSFVLNAKATRSEPNAGESTNSSQSRQGTMSVSSKDLFTIDDDLGDEWWNV